MHEAKISVICTCLSVLIGIVPERLCMNTLIVSDCFVHEKLIFLSELQKLERQLHQKCVLKGVSSTRPTGPKLKELDQKSEIPTHGSVDCVQGLIYASYGAGSIGNQ